MANIKPEINIAIVRYENHKADIEQIRRTVFIVEQGIPESLEWDEFEHSSWHFLARCNGDPAGTGRLQCDGKITRIAVLKSWRNYGVASEIMRAVLAKAEAEKLDNLFLNAQTTATGLYESFGFVRSGQVFDEGGIPHVKMIRL